MSLENIVTKGEIDHDDQFLQLPNCFQLYSIYIHSSMENFHIFAPICSKFSAGDLMYVAKGQELNVIYKTYDISKLKSTF